MGYPDQLPFAALTGAQALFVWLRLVVGILFPLLLAWMAWKTAQTRSMESATGLRCTPLDRSARLAGELIDRAALHAVIDGLYRLGFDLMAVERSSRRHAP